ncbi:ARID DNA-binding domain-containing protein, partial [Baffinella frigidus]
MEGGAEASVGNGSAEEKDRAHDGEPEGEVDGVSGAGEQGGAVAAGADRMDVDPPVQSAGAGGAGGREETESEEDELEIDEEDDEGEDEGEEGKGGEAEDQDSRQDADGVGAGRGDVGGGGEGGDESAQEIAEWIERWRAFLIERGQPVLKQAPTISGKPVDIFRLYHETTQRGGMDEVLTKRQLIQVANALGYDQQQIHHRAQRLYDQRQIHNTAQRLKRFYSDNLASFEAWELRGEKTPHNYSLPSTHGRALSEVIQPGATLSRTGRPGRPSRAARTPAGAGSGGGGSVGGDSPMGGEEKSERVWGGASSAAEQQVRDWDAVSRSETEAWMRDWTSAMQRRGLKSKVPLFGGIRLDVHRMFLTVASYGGFDAVCRKRKWREVQRQMDLEDVLGVTLKQHYLKLLRAYETILAGGEEEPAFT